LLVVAAVVLLSAVVAAVVDFVPAQLQQVAEQ
jgi:hypothetical protein